MTARLADLRLRAVRTAAETGRLRCRMVKLLAYRAESGGRSWPAGLDRHIAGCLACQAEIVRERQLLRALWLMANEVELAPVGLESVAFDAYPIAPDPGPAEARWGSAAAVASVSAAALGVALLVGRRLRAAAI